MTIPKEYRYETLAITLAVFGAWVLATAFLGFGHLLLSLFYYMGGTALGVGIVMLAKILPSYPDCPAWLRKFIVTRLTILTER